MSQRHVAATNYVLFTHKDVFVCTQCEFVVLHVQTTRPCAGVCRSGMLQPQNYVLFTHRDVFVCTQCEFAQCCFVQAMHARRLRVKAYDFVAEASLCDMFLRHNNSCAKSLR